MIDAHCHLQELENIDGQVQRCSEIGINAIICNGHDLESSKQAVQLAEKYKTVFATVGIHPDQAGKINPDPNLENELISLATHPKVVAIGETGLDNPDSTQIELFEWHVHLAKKSELPLVVHCRNAFTEIY